MFALEFKESASDGDLQRLGNYMNVLERGGAFTALYPANVGSVEAVKLMGNLPGDYRLTLRITALSLPWAMTSSG